MKGPKEVRPPFRYTLSSAIRHYRDRINATQAFANRLGQVGSGRTPEDVAQMLSASPDGMAQETVSPERQHLLQYTLGDSNYNTTINDDSPANFRSATDTFNDELDSDEEAQQVEQADHDGLYPPNCTWTGDGEVPARADPFGNARCTVWWTIHELSSPKPQVPKASHVIRKTIMDCIDDPYSVEQLKAPRMNISVVRPLVDKLYNMQDLSVVYCLLINRTQFIREQSYATHHQSVNLTRALLCELLAEKVLRRYNEHNPGPLGLLKLANILVAGFEPFQGAPLDMFGESGNSANSLLNQRKMWSYEKRMTALEVAIVSDSKSFLASSACQKVVDAIYCGRIVYTPNSFIDIIPDHWKKRPISLYDPLRAPLLNQYRMIVPRTRNIIEAAQFVVLLALYIIVMTSREEWHTIEYTMMELVFDIYTAGWVLDQIASILEHGWRVYTQNLWSFLDVIFMIQFTLYISLRMHGLRVDHVTDPMAPSFGRTALDILSCAAPILVPRLAFNVMSGNMLFLSLRAMMSDFLTLVALAIWCFGGFLLGLKWLHDGAYEPETIGKWMLWIWFGLDGTGIDQAPDFHWLLGPMLMIVFAFLGDLFLTILVSMLSNTFSLITSNAVQEIQYRRSVLTFLGVKSDAIFAYLPPFNLLAFFFVLPLKFLLSPRIFHKFNVVCVKSLNAPLLLVIALYERRVLWVPTRVRRFQPEDIDWTIAGGPNSLASNWWSKTFQLWDFSKFSAHGDIQAVFDAEPPGGMSPEQNPGSNINTTNDHYGKYSSKSTPTSSTLLRPGLETQTGVTARIRSKSERSSKQRLESADRLNESYTSGSNAAPSSTLKGWMSRNRKDSIVEYDGTQGSIHEIDARLIKLEQSMDRIEGFLQQLVESNRNQEEDSSEDESETQKQLSVDARVERI